MGIHEEFGMPFTHSHILLPGESAFALGRYSDTLITGVGNIPLMIFTIHSLGHRNKKIVIRMLF